jgi:hypothetical protein
MDKCEKEREAGEVRRGDLTKETWTPRLRCTAEQSMQRKTP